MKLLEFLNRKTGYRHWYQIKAYYKTSPSGKTIFDFSAKVGMANQSDIIKHREVMKMFPAHNRGISHLLCNGIMYYEVISYLGWFKK